MDWWVACSKAMMHSAGLKQARVLPSFSVSRADCQLYVGNGINKIVVPLSVLNTPEEGRPFFTHPHLFCGHNPS